ncbi:glycoside hydrolase family 2 protein [Pediococcus acidilactici]|uniref:glycoside hydrolase family 2 protein n=1 Tax=Pediococcus acidilactici TaxID=1254 RepID=UPI0019504341|nr:sugar-binding domain-containing protein [Pediococcus acidilactici]MBM6585013.1 glycoside hydrolase family 2 [Pediococcus acidilactici]
MEREEYPRPQFQREDWMNLNGEWQFEFDDNQIGKTDRWYLNNYELSNHIQVPFAFQSKLSQVQDTSFHDVVWYKRKLNCPIKWKTKQIVINFGAVDYKCEIYLNGKLVGEHEGGNTSFSFNITDFLNFQEDILTVYVEDPSKDETIPRGKQYWLEKPDSIWYTRTTGIWQTVWLEALDEINITSVKYHTKVLEAEVTMDFLVSQAAIGSELEVEIIFEGKKIVKDKLLILEKNFSRSFRLYKNKIFAHNFHGNDYGWSWTPETPHLFDVNLRIIKKQRIYDTITSYFGLREIHVEDGKIYLNNRPYYQKLVLDQGYWPEGLLTAPTDKSFITDIKLSKEMGFNGCRKHQKVEDPRFLYWADKLGFLVWGECASAVSFDNNSVHRLTNEWFEIIERDFNHPSIIAWVPLNESWGVPDIRCNKMQQAHSLTLYYLIHSLDDSRLVISNDGWENTKTDICTVHNYAHGMANQLRKYEKFKRDLSTKECLLKSSPSGRSLYAKGFSYRGEPILLTEFGGIGYEVNKSNGWGYTSVDNKEEFLNDYKRIMSAIYSSTVLEGYCYTQLTDVEQEINGLLTYDRKPKCEVEIIKSINDNIE